jgi:hypothetical protein
VVILVGSNFRQTAELSCAFGTLVAMASYKSGTQLECQSPAQGGGTVPVEVSNNNQDYSTSVILFTYHGIVADLNV